MSLPQWPLVADHCCGAPSQTRAVPRSFVCRKWSQTSCTCNLCRSTECPEPESNHNMIYYMYNSGNMCYKELKWKKRERRLYFLHMGSWHLGFSVAHSLLLLGFWSHIDRDGSRATSKAAWPVTQQSTTENTCLYNSLQHETLCLYNSLQHKTLVCTTVYNIKHLSVQQSTT